MQGCAEPFPSAEQMSLSEEMLPHQEEKWWMNQDMSKFPGPILINKNGERRKKRNAEQTSPEGDWN